MKKVLKILAGILIVVVILFIALLIWLDGAIVNGFNTAAPTALGVPASLGDARILPVRGKLTLNDLHIGNPDGYKTDGLIDIGTLYIRYDTASVMTDTIIINEITIDALVVTYEKGLLNSNLGALLDLLSSEKKGEEKEDKKEAAEDEENAKKKVIIEKLMITDSQMNFSVTAAMGAAIPIPLPAITLTDLGKESEGITVVQAIQKVLTAIAGATGTAIAGSGKLIGQGVQAVGDGAAAAGGAAVDAGKAVGGAVGDAGGATMDAGKAVGGAIGNAGKATGRALNPFD